MIIAIDDPSAPEAARQAIAQGAVIAFPTDTVYGVGVNLWRRDAVARLYDLKGRPADKALPVLLGHEDQWVQVACELPEAARHLMRVFWPGALTIVVPRRPDVPDALGPGAPTIALRVPAHDALRKVLMRTGPLATSSANRSGDEPASTAAAVQAALRNGLALVLDGGALAASAPSTVVDATTAEIAILRHGAIPAEDIEKALRPLTTAPHPPAPSPSEGAGG